MSIFEAVSSPVPKHHFGALQPLVSAWNEQQVCPPENQWLEDDPFKRKECKPYLKTSFQEKKSFFGADCTRSCTKMLRVSPFSFVDLLRLRLWHKMDKAFKTPREYAPNFRPHVWQRHFWIRQRICCGVCRFFHSPKNATWHFCVQYPSGKFFYIPYLAPVQTWVDDFSLFHPFPVWWDM